MIALPEAAFVGSVRRALEFVVGAALLSIVTRLGVAAAATTYRLSASCSGQNAEVIDRGVSAGSAVPADRGRRDELLDPALDGQRLQVRETFLEGSALFVGVVP
jgi:hypothetical protein